MVIAPQQESIAVVAQRAKVYDHFGHRYERTRFTVRCPVGDRSVNFGTITVLSGPDGLLIVKASTPDDVHQLFDGDGAVGRAAAWLRARPRYVVVDTAYDVRRFWRGDGRHGAVWTSDPENARWFWDRANADTQMHQINRRLDKRGDAIYNCTVSAVRAFLP